MNRFVLAVVGFCFFAAGARADDLKDDPFENLQSPVTTDAKYALLAGAGLTAALLATRAQTVDRVQDYAVRQKPLGASSKHGDLLGQNVPNALYAIGMFTYGRLHDDPASLRDASAMLQATLYSGLATNVVKLTVQEPRPNDPGTRNAFPSGHTTTAFAFASYVGCRHGWALGAAAHAMASFVGFSRINDNAHYLHDVVAGAAIGESYGLGICFAEQSGTDAVKNPPVARWRWALHDAAFGPGVLFTRNF